MYSSYVSYHSYDYTQSGGFGFQHFNQQADPNKTRAGWKMKGKKYTSMLVYSGLDSMWTLVVPIIGLANMETGRLVPGNISCAVTGGGCTGPTISPPILVRLYIALYLGNVENVNDKHCMNLYFVEIFWNISFRVSFITHTWRCVIMWRSEVSTPTWPVGRRSPYVATRLTVASDSLVTELSTNTRLFLI